VLRYYSPIFFNWLLRKSIFFYYPSCWYDLYK